MRTPSLDKSKPAAPARPTTRLSPALVPHCQALVNRLGLAAGLIDAPQAVGFTSAARRAGVSTLAAGVAILVAESGRQALLIDACWKNPALDRRFNLSPAPGLREFLSGEASFAKAVASTDVQNLHVLPCGRHPAGSLLVSSRPALVDLIAQAKERFDLIVFDLPPALPEEPVIVWTGALDGVLLVVQAEQTVAEQARRAKQTLLDSQAHLLGAVLNRHRSYLPRWLG